MGFLKAVNSLKKKASRNQIVTKGNSKGFRFVFMFCKCVPRQATLSMWYGYKTMRGKKVVI